MGGLPGPAAARMVRDPGAVFRALGMRTPAESAALFAALMPPGLAALTARGVALPEHATSLLLAYPFPPFGDRR